MRGWDNMVTHTELYALISVLVSLVSLVVYVFRGGKRWKKRLIACSPANCQAISLIKLAWGQPLIGVPHYAKDSITLPGNRQQLFRMLFALWCRIYTIMSITSLALDKYERFWTFYPPGAFSQPLNFCIPPEFWINSMIFADVYSIFGSFSVSLGSFCGHIAG